MLLCQQQYKIAAHSNVAITCPACCQHTHPPNTRNQVCPHMGVVVLTVNQKEQWHTQQPYYDEVKLISWCHTKDVIQILSWNATPSNTHMPHHDGIAMTLLRQSATKMVMPHYLSQWSKTQKQHCTKKQNVMHHPCCNVRPKQTDPWQMRTPYWKQECPKASYPALDTTHPGYPK